MVLNPGKLLVNALNVQAEAKVSVFIAKSLWRTEIATAAKYIQPAAKRKSKKINKN